jgi:putative transposase
MFIEQEKANHSVKRMCQVLGVSRSGYYAWLGRGPSSWGEADEKLLETVKAIHEESRGIYGAPRIHAELRDLHQIRCSRKRVARLMREAGLVGVHRRKQHGTTRRDPQRLGSPELVERNFEAAAPNQLWVADITQHPTSEGWLYLAVILDAYSRKVVGWAMNESIAAELVLKALEMALWNRQPPEGVIHHSDHGSQYTSLVFGAKLEEAGILGSMGSVGDALDNALAESFFATLQTELLDRYDWPTRQSLRSAIFEFIEVFYNRRRRHSSLGYLSPEAFELRVQRNHGRGYADQQAA